MRLCIPFFPSNNHLCSDFIHSWRVGALCVCNRFTHDERPVHFINWIKFLQSFAELWLEHLKPPLHQQKLYHHSTGNKVKKNQRPVSWFFLFFYWLLYILSLVLGLVEAVGETALAAVVPVEVAGHENASAALVSWALATQTVDLSVLIDLTGRETISLGCSLY